MLNRPLLKLCLVTNMPLGWTEDYRRLLLQAVDGGVTSVQLKHKDLIQAEALAIKLQSVLKPRNIPLIINDHVNIVKKVDAAGAHLGQADMDPWCARRMLGPSKIIGWSVESEEELAKANKMQCLDYIGASAVFPSKTKLDCKKIWGLDGLRMLADNSIHPVVAMGGICVDNISSVIEHGATGVTVVSAIHDQPNPRNAAADLIQAIDLMLNQEKRECFRMKKNR